jgi:hypothetical protein
MLRFLKILCPMALAGFMTLSSPAFSLLGPPTGTAGDSWQIPEIGYDLGTLSIDNPGGQNILGDIGGPKNIGEEYRRNMPVLYYSYDASWLNFFGATGTNAVDQAFAIMNSVPPISQCSPDLSEFPVNVQEFNPDAEFALLTDVKSMTMHLLAEQLGLAQPERWTWTLHFRYQIPGTTCPAGMLYLVTMRNFGIMPSAGNQVQYSQYVNGNLWTYEILEDCLPPDPVALAAPISADPFPYNYTAVASDLSWSTAALGLQLGGFYTSLSRDDVAGLRYLIQTNNANWESTGPGTYEIFTNVVPALLTTLDLGLLAAQAATNNTATLEGLYPGLIVTDGDTNVSWGFAVTTNLTAYFTNSPLAPAGSPPTLAYTTNYTTNIVTHYVHTFANLVTNSYYTRSFITVQTTAFTNSPLSPAGSPPTLQTFSTTYVTNMFGGDFYIIPAGDCGVSVLSNLLTTTIITSNLTVSATNASGESFTQSVVTYFTNHALVYLPVTCPTNVIALWQGIDKITFVKHDYDPLFGQYFSPITNDYYMNEITNNNVLVRRHIQRVVTQPDFLLVAEDLAANNGNVSWNGPGNGTVARSLMNFNQNFIALNNQANNAGPGTIEPPSTFIYNKVGPLYLNGTGNSIYFINGFTNQIQLLQWASFDGTTNPPILYPNGTSIADLENSFLMFFTPNSLPDGTVGMAYPNVQFSGTGGTPPYSWSLTPGGSGLPDGLNLSSSGQISGTPTLAWTYDFSIRMTDSGGLFVDIPFAVNINQ